MPPVSPGKTPICNGARPCHPAPVAPLHSSLTQITKRYAVEWNGLTLAVESGVDCWTVRVHVPGDKKPLYEAHRGMLAAAKAVGAEFAMFQSGEAVGASPERLAATLAWEERWNLA